MFFKSGQKSTNHINLTQISKVSKIRKAILNLIKLLKCQIVQYKIDNINSKILYKKKEINSLHII